MKFLIAACCTLVLLALGPGCASNQTASAIDGRVWTGYTVSATDTDRLDGVAGWTMGSPAAETR